MGNFNEFRTLLIAGMAAIIVTGMGYFYVVQAAVVAQNTRDIVNMQLVLERITTLIEMEQRRSIAADPLPVHRADR